MAAPLRGSPWQQSLNPSWRAQRSHSSSVHRHQHPCQVLNEHTHPVRDVAVAGQHRVTVCDKANILNSYAFFRAVATEVAQSYPDVEIDYAYADAITRAHDQEARLLRRDCGQKHVWRHHLRSRCRHGGQPGRGFIGRAGRTPWPVPGCARLGPRHCRERRCHPVATMLSAALMLRWLAERHTDAALTQDALRIETAVEAVLAQGLVVPADQGGMARCREFTQAVLRQLR